MEQPKATVKRVPTHVGLSPMQKVTEEMKRRDRARKRAEKKKIADDYARRKKYQDDLDSQKVEKEVGPVRATKYKIVSRDQVMAYLCGLTLECGRSPTQAQARSYSQSNHSLVFPKNAIEVLGASNWEEVLAIYEADTMISGSLKEQVLKKTESPKAESQDSASPQKKKPELLKEEPLKTKSAHKSTGKRYTDEELLAILTEIWHEMDGKISQSKIAKRAKLKPTPSWMTLIKRFGSPKTWGEQIAAPKKTDEKLPAKLADLVTDEEPSTVEEPLAVVESSPTVDTSTTDKPLETSAKLEVKIKVPGIEPITLEFTVKSPT